MLLLACKHSSFHICQSLMNYNCKKHLYYYLKQCVFLTSWLQLSSQCSSCFKLGNQRTLLMNQLKVTPCLSLKFSYLVMKRGPSLFLLLCILLPSCGYFFSFTSWFNKILGFAPHANCRFHTLSSNFYKTCL